MRDSRNWHIRALMAPAAAALLLAAATPAAGRSRPAAAPATDNPASCIIDGVTVLPMTPGSHALRRQTVVIDRGRIKSISRSRPARRRGACHVDGRGKFLLPGLADMHVHIFDLGMLSAGKLTASEAAAQDADLLLPFVANGVLQVFNLSASPSSLRQRDAVERGELLGPRQATALLVDGDPPMVGGGLATIAKTPEEGRAVVRAAHAAGYDAIKSYSALDFETFQAIREEAGAQGMKLLGHIPLRGAGRTGDLLAPGFTMVAHAEEYAYQAKEISVADVPGYTNLARERGVWLDTTLVLNERVVERTIEPAKLLARAEIRYIHPQLVAFWRDHNNYASSRDKLPRRQAVTQFNPMLIKAFAAAGVPLVTGTDTGIAGIMPGFGLLDEMEGLSRIGLPADLVLEAATRRPAEYLGVLADRGTVEPGKRADLILLDADPRIDMANIRKLSAVFLGGRLYSKRDLDGRMDALARRYAALPVAATAAAVSELGHDDH